MKDENMDRYEAIMHLQRPVSDKHPPMSMKERAAQFAPFAALTGFGEAVKETARLTKRQAQLDEDEKALLDERLIWLLAHKTEEPEVRITYFVPDDKKEGGAFIEKEGVVKGFDDYNRRIVMADGTYIFLDAITAIEMIG